MNKPSTLKTAIEIGEIIQEHLQQLEKKNVRVNDVIGVINEHGYSYTVKSFRAFLRSLRDNGNLRSHLPQAYQRKKKGAKRGWWYFTYVKEISRAK